MTLGEEVGVLGSERRGIGFGDDVAVVGADVTVSVAGGVAVWGRAEAGSEGVAVAEGVADDAGVRYVVEGEDEVAAAEPNDNLRGTALNVTFSDCNLR